ncbi:class F sortase [Gordonia spumicola]|uniref:Class F sortase n=1 Tax=Gordonia spumicola TaxID=589161 RepID=A0A7I9V628_9ACTN|nr:class F sortase [Gordonia spumicola]GEE00511.1 class F sortase [Gordonia spumicola]
MPSVVPPSSTGGVVPATIAIPSLQVSARVEPKGTVMEYAKFLGRDVPSFGVPTDMMDTTWWSDGPRPGSDGMAVILGHTQVGGPGVFNDISRMRNGDTIVVTAASGEAVEFSVTRVVADIPKSDPSALNKALTSAPKGSGIALVTCGGRFDSAVDASVDNIVVFAEPRRG